MSAKVIERLRQRFGDRIIEPELVGDQGVAWVAPEHLLEIAAFLKDDPEMNFDMPLDCTCVDWMGKGEVRFEVIYHFYSVKRGHRMRLKLKVSENDASCPSLTPLWPGLNWHEREAWDMYGIRFKGHPNLKRVLMYEEFKGHPLRKDYPVDARQPLIEMRPVAEVRTQREPTPGYAEPALRLSDGVVGLS